MQLHSSWWSLRTKLPSNNAYAVSGADGAAAAGSHSVVTVVTGSGQSMTDLPVTPGAIPTERGHR